MPKSFVEHVYTALSFRSSRSGRQFDSSRTRTGQIDHDVFEGLPVRRWSRQPHTHSQAPKTEDSEFVVQGPGGTGRLPELAMPRDSQLLGAGSRALLRAARAGCIYIHQNIRTSDKDEKEAGEGDDGATGTHAADRSFVSRKWSTLPKQLEPADVEFLAKRRPGLPSLYGGTAAVDGSGSGPGPMRRTKFQKTDSATGKISIYEAWVPEGHRIEGEITGDVQALAGQSDVSVNSEMPAPGTVVEGVGIVNSEGVVIAEAGSASVMTPPKRRPPPPKRKGKGIGKGRKKKVMFAPGEGADAAAVHGVSTDPTVHTDGPREGQEALQVPIDRSGQEDDEDGDDVEDGEDGDDGDDGEDSDEADESIMDAKTPETPQAPYVAESADHPAAASTTETKDIEMTDVAFEPQPPVSVNSSVTRPEVVPEPSGKSVTEVNTSQNTLDPRDPPTSIPVMETAKNPSTEYDSDPYKQASGRFGSPELPNESIKPGISSESELGAGAVIEEHPQIHEPRPSTESNIPEAPAADPIQETAGIPTPEAKRKIESTGADSLGSASTDHAVHAEEVHFVPPQAREPEPELTVNETTHSASNVPQIANTLVPEAGEDKGEASDTLEKDQTAPELKEDLQSKKSPGVSGHNEAPQANEPITAIHPKTPPLLSSLTSTEPLPTIDPSESSNLPASRETTLEERNLTPNPDPTQPNSPIPAPSGVANTQVPDTTESVSAFQGDTKETKDNSEPASEPA
ncbi:hypothetical protein N7456_000771 [Penicillium angulare]|uniref:LYR family protein n=1 Tax=Penicillium angulare TaxID=116970 RepID=A0A9W9GE38_9EURO|nr:hypothetical protein N7456_000771 [Penicillium angulare]